ncbi:MAG: hypothetical protein ABEJ65_07340 [bacterium]
MTNSKAYAVLDLGTNSTRFLLYEGAPETFRPSGVVDRGSVVTRLGEDLQSTGRLLPEAQQRVIDVLERYHERVTKQGGEWVAGIATHAVRHASNGDRFLARVRELLGITPECISGEKEAQLIYQGISRVFPDMNEGRIIDIGGGSTEWIRFGNGTLRSAVSLEIGVVTLRERCVGSERWKNQFSECIRETFRNVISGVTPAQGDIVALGGTPTTISALNQQLNSYRSEAIHGDYLTLETIQNVRRSLEEKTIREINKMKLVREGRADVLLPGIHVLECFAEWSNASGIIVSDFGILVGCLEEATCGVS